MYVTESLAPSVVLEAVADIGLFIGERGAIRSVAPGDEVPRKASATTP